MARSNPRPSAKRHAQTATNRSTAATRAGRRTGRTHSDAIALLKSDHRQVEDWFEQFEKARGDDRKRDLAKKICDALRVHTQIEEEIFYPAFYQATGDEDLHHKAVIEHDGAKKLIAEIESSGPDDDFYDARVSVLSEMIKHHVKEEEQRDGLFAKARSSGMDLSALREQLASRKTELESAPEILKGLKRTMDAGRGLVTRLVSST